MLNIKCVFWFPLQHLSETFTILRRAERDVIKNMYIVFHVKYSLFLSDFNETWNILDRLSKNTQIPNFMKIRLVEVELFHADGQIWRISESHFAILQKRLNSSQLISYRKVVDFVPRTILNMQIHSVGRTSKFLLLNLVIHTVTIRLKRAKFYIVVFRLITSSSWAWILTLKTKTRILTTF